MKKKVVLAVLVFVLAFTACGRKVDTKEAEDIRVEKKEETVSEAEEESVDAPEEEPKEPEIKSAREPAESSETEETEEQVPAFEKGIVSENGWESQWIGLRFTAPEGMKMSTEEELDALMGLSAEILSDDLGEAQLKYAELTSIKEMMCVDPGTNVNVIVSVDLLPMELSEELFAQALEETLSNISAMDYEALGDNERVDLAGISFLRSGYYVEAVGQKMYLDYYLKTTGFGNRAVSIVVTYGEDCEEVADAMVEGFEAY